MTSAASSPPPLSQNTLSLEEGIKRVLGAVPSAFRELRGKLIKTEERTGPLTPFRLRKTYAGKLIFGGATSAEIQETYPFTQSNFVTYTYKLQYPRADAEAAAKKAGDLVKQLNQILPTFVHSHGIDLAPLPHQDRWTLPQNRPPLISLDRTELPGSLEADNSLQFSTGFDGPQW